MVPMLIESRATTIIMNVASLLRWSGVELPMVVKFPLAICHLILLVLQNSGLIYQLLIVRSINHRQLYS
jgi:hypothetical protein